MPNFSNEYLAYWEKMYGDTPPPTTVSDEFVKAFNLANNSESKTPFAKFGLYVSDTYGGTYILNKRAIIENFRTQLRGLGSCGVVILPKDQINEQIDQALREGQFVKIIDCTNYFENEYSSTGDELFFGTITSITVDTYAEKDDDRGYAQIDEIGHYFNKKPIIWNSKPQVFNPIVSGIAYGNKKSDANQFETLISNMATATLDGQNSGKFANTNTATDTTGSGNKKVWTLENFLTYMAELYNVDVGFPWELDADVIRKKAEKLKEGLDPNNEKDQEKIEEIDKNTTSDIQLVEYKYRFFKDSTEVRSYDHFDGRSFQELLSEVLDEPFDWYFTAESTNYPKIQIINKSPVESIDLCPKTQLIDKKIDPEITTNFNITKQDEVYDRVIFKGDNILIAGTLGNWNCNGSASMDKDWRDSDGGPGLPNEELNYVNADNELNSLNAGNDTKLALAASIRSKNKKVYQQFKYKHLEQSCPIQIPKKIERPGLSNPKEFTQAPLYPTGDGSAAYDMTPFFPRIDFVKYESNSILVLPNPVVYTSLTQHKTPPLLELKWADSLPWKVDGNKDTRKPFIVATSFLLDSSGEPRYFTYDLTKSGGGYDTCSFKHTLTGYQLEMQYPETLAYVDEDRNLFNCNGTAVDTPSDYWTSDKLSDRNPATTNYKFLTNWKLLAATVAGFSDQRLEWSVDNPNSTRINKIKIIEDRSLQCWFAHAGTIKEVVTGLKGIGSGTGRLYTTGYDRFSNDTFIRNDFKKVYDLARHYSNWLFTPKASAKIELSLMLYGGGTYILGETIGNIVDKTIKRPINTTVASIEYDCVANRIYISTNIPEMPILKKLQNSPMSRSVISPSSDSKEPTIEIKEKVITKTEYPTHGYVSGGSGISTEKQEIWLRVVDGAGAGNPLTSGQYGIKKISTQLPNQTSWKDVYATATLPDGLGRATIWINGEQQVTADAPLYVAGATYSLNQQVSFNDKGYKCSVPGVSTTFNAGNAQFVEDETILEKPKQVFLLLDNRAQFGYAIAQYEWIRVFSEITFGNATNPATGTAQDMKAYTGAFF